MDPAGRVYLHGQFRGFMSNLPSLTLCGFVILIYTVVLFGCLLFSLVFSIILEVFHVFFIKAFHCVPPLVSFLI